MKYLVIDVGGTFTKYAVMDEECNFYAKNKIATRQENLQVFVEMLVQIYEGYRGEVAGIALSSAGIIDSETGFMYNAGSLFCVKDVNIVEVLERHCGVPVSVENDAKCAALAEVWRGALSDCRNAVAVICGTAVGGAVIVDRKVLRGKHFMAGEFSYVLTDVTDAMNPEKTLAKSGGMPTLISMVAERKGMKEEMNGEKIFSMANTGDEEVLACVREFAHRLAVQITNYQYILDPERIAIGGGVSAQPLFLQMIKEELKKLNTVYPYDVPIPEVVTCKFFNDSNLIGALYVFLKAQEEKIDLEKVREFMSLMGNRREGRYLREFLAAR